MGAQLTKSDFKCPCLTKDKDDAKDDAKSSSKGFPEAIDPAPLTPRVFAAEKEADKLASPAQANDGAKATEPEEEPEQNSPIEACAPTLAVEENAESEGKVQKDVDQMGFPASFEGAIEQNAKAEEVAEAVAKAWCAKLITNIQNQALSPDVDVSQYDGRAEAAVKVTNEEPKDFALEKANHEDVKPEEAAEHLKEASGKHGKAEEIAEDAKAEEVAEAVAKEWCATLITNIQNQALSPDADASQCDGRTEDAVKATNDEPKYSGSEKADHEDVKPEEAAEHLQEASREDGKAEGEVEEAAPHANAMAAGNEVEREAAATRIQSVRRGSLVRREQRARADIKEEGTPEEAVAQPAPSDDANTETAGNEAEREAAATRIQSVRRGSLVRREQGAKADTMEDKAEEAVEDAAAQPTPSEEANCKDCQVEVTAVEAAAQSAASDDVIAKDEKVEAAEAPGADDETEPLDATNAVSTSLNVTDGVPPADKSGEVLKQAAAKGKKGKKGKKQCGQLVD